MGNYKQGEIVAKIGKNVPDSVLDLFADFLFYEKDRNTENREKRMDRIRENNAKLKNTTIDFLDIEIYPYCKINGNIEEVDISFYSCMIESEKRYGTLNIEAMQDIYCSEEYFQVMNMGITKTKAILKLRKYEYLVVKFKVFGKSYRTGLDEMAEFLRPYLFETSSNIAGYISDEDGVPAYNHKIYFCKDEVVKTQKKRSYLCQGCSEYSKIDECKNFEKCNRAYKLGQKSK